MKQFVSVVIVCSFVLNCTYARRRDVRYTAKNPVAVSERVGDVIDSDEREYFDLFLETIYIRPLTYQYTSATISPSYDGGYVVHISATNGTLCVVNNDPRGLDILAEYIDNYEEIEESREKFEEKWDIVDYDDMGLPITKHEMDIMWNEIISGKKTLSGQRNATGLGAFLGGCLGGILAYAVIKKLGLGSGDDQNDPYEELLNTYLEWTAIFLIGGSGLCLGAVAGTSIGYMGSTVPVLTESDYDHSIILDSIKEQRMARVLGK